MKTSDLPEFLYLGIDEAAYQSALASAPPDERVLVDQRDYMMYVETVTATDDDLRRAAEEARRQASQFLQHADALDAYRLQRQRDD